MNIFHPLNRFVVFLFPPFYSFIFFSLCFVLPLCEVHAFANSPLEKELIMFYVRVIKGLM